MREDDLRKIRCISSNPTTYLGEIIATGLPIIIKELQFSALADASEALEEALKQVRLNAHPNVATLYGATLNQRGNWYIVCLAMERLDTNLHQEIERRVKTRNFWVEKQLWEYLIPVVSALEYAQSVDLCHRDIQPRSLFLTNDGVIKVGDFSSARHCTSQSQTSTVKGSPNFLSPVLQSAYAQSMGRTNLQVQHNMYKSDVYSLGLTWLYMAKLGASERISKGKGMESTARMEIDTINYSKELKTLLGYMLEEEESRRPDFRLLKEWLCGSPKGEGNPPENRPSNASTDASNRPSSIQLYPSISSVAQESISEIPNQSCPFPAIKPATDFSQNELVDALNSSFDPDKFAYLVANQGPYCLIADVFLSVKCQFCGNYYSVAFIKGHPSVPELLFCSRTCLQHYSFRPARLDHSPSPLSALPRSPAHEKIKELQQQSEHDFRQRIERNCCVSCGKRPIENTDFSTCQKCISKQERRYAKLSKEECPQCHKKWPKQPFISRLFRKKSIDIITLPCKHKLCSIDCFRQTVSTSLSCPTCGADIPAKFLQYMKVSSD